jgi:hypothetical protein
MSDTWLLEEYRSAKEWLESRGHFYLRANILIPEKVIDEAIDLYERGYFVPHRSTDSKGWESCTLHGVASNITTYNPDDKPKYHWTEVADIAPTMTQWLKEDFPNNGKYGRCRFMLLQSGGFIRKHTDTHQWVEGMPLKNDIASAINIAITQPDNCYLRNSETLEEVPFKPREVYWFNNGPFHEAANFSKKPRIHFILHGGTNEDRIRLFLDSFNKEHPDAII